MLVILSGVSGAGKDTTKKELIRTINNTDTSIIHIKTTKTR